VTEEGTGETYQAKYADGTGVYLEQVSHHPPVSMFQIVGPQGKWSFSGHHEFTASMRPNSITGSQIGPNCVQFEDGTTIEFNLPYLLLRGLLWGERNVNWCGNVVFTDTKNDLKAEVLFNSDEGSIFSRWFSSAPDPPCDRVKGLIVSAKKQAPAPNGEHREVSIIAKMFPNLAGHKIFSEMDGSWMEQLDFDGVRYWTRNAILPLSVIEDGVACLPSDCSNREDLKALLAGDEEAGQKHKTALEELQRKDQKLRKQNHGHAHGHGHGHGHGNHNHHHNNHKHNH